MQCGASLIKGDLNSTVSWLSRLVAMDTRNGSGDEVACTQMLRAALAAHNPDQLICETVARSRGKRESGYVMAAWGRPKILLNVHIDTVPSGAGWTADPLTLREDGGRYIGLGSSDIKGAAACILSMLETTPPKDVAILFSGDEEHGSEVMPAVINRGHTGGAPMAIVCEPTGCTAGRRHRGMLAVSAKFSGPGGHSSLSDMTAAPLLSAARLAAAIGDYGDAHREFGTAPYKGLCTNIGELRSDGAYNVIPTEAELLVSMRPPPGDDVAAREADINAICKSLSPEAEVSRIVALQPFEAQDIDAFAPVFGDLFTPSDLPYWTEAAMLSAAGINCTVYGPGDVDQAHKPNEYVTGDHLMSAMQVYGHALSGCWDA